MSKHVLRKRLSGFTTVSNNVIKVLKGDLELLGFYLYLLSLPDEWQFYKTDLMKTCAIGMKKLDSMLKKLSVFELIVYGQRRGKDGKFESFFIDIYDTESIKNIDLESYSQDKIINNRPFGNLCRTDSTDERFQQSIKKVLQNKNKIIKKREPARKKREPLSDDFVFNEENKERCKAKDLDDKNVLSKFKAWAKASGIIREDWQAEAELWIARENKILHKEPVKHELKCNVKEYGPGHPTWEANQEWNRKHGKQVQGNNDRRTTLQQN